MNKKPNLKTLMENKDWRKEVDKKFLEVSCECGARDLFDFIEVKSFIESLLKSKQEEIEGAIDAMYKDIPYAPTTDKTILDKVFNQALDELKPIINNILKS